MKKLISRLFRKRKFIYKVENIGRLDKKIPKYLNEQGQDGWELISVIFVGNYDYMLYLKKRI